MNLQALIIFLLAFVASTYAAISPEVYWKIKLPNTQIPKVIKDFLPQSDNDVELKQGNNKKKVYYGLSGYIAISWHHDASMELERFVQENPSMNSGSSKNLIKEVTDVKVTYGPLKQYFFLEKDLEKGKVMEFPSFLNKNQAPFLNRQLVESIPFSMDKFPEILNHFAINSKSKDAQTIKNAIELCEEPVMTHIEKKTCVTSLESMVDFGLSALGTNNILAISSEVQGGSTQTSQNYTIEQVQEIFDGYNMVCHKLNYAYAVHLCHIAGSARTYMVSMVGADGTKVKGVSVCHKDTSFWNPNALPFVLLNVKRGTTSICHFLHDDQIAFVPI